MKHLVLYRTKVFKEFMMITFQVGLFLPASFRIEYFFVPYKASQECDKSFVVVRYKLSLFVKLYKSPGYRFKPVELNRIGYNNTHKIAVGQVYQEPELILEKIIVILPSLCANVN